MKSIIITSSCHINVTSKNLIEIKTKDEKKRTFDTNSLDFLIVENNRSTITISAINLLSKNLVSVIMCDTNHLPTSQLTSISGCYPRKHNIYVQIGLPQEFKDKLWAKIIQEKIQNQINVLEILDYDIKLIEKCRYWKELVDPGDASNREGTIARIFFRALYGSWFLRESDIPINNALNYGYAILSSTIATYICSHGLVPMLGIHHCNKINTWNLVYDLVEVIRPIIDYWVVTHLEELRLELTTENKVSLVDVLKVVVSFNDQKRKLRSAIKDYIASFIQVIDNQDPNLLKVPYIINQGW